MCLAVATFQNKVVSRCGGPCVCGLIPRGRLRLCSQVAIFMIAKTLAPFSGVKPFAIMGTGRRAPGREHAWPRHSRDQSGQTTHNGRRDVRWSRHAGNSRCLAFLRGCRVPSQDNAIRANSTCTPRPRRRPTCTLRAALPAVTSTTPASGRCEALGPIREACGGSFPALAEISRAATAV